MRRIRICRAAVWWLLLTLRERSRENEQQANFWLTPQVRSIGRELLHTSLFWKSDIRGELQLAGCFCKPCIDEISECLGIVQRYHCVTRRKCSSRLAAKDRPLASCGIAGKLSCTALDTNNCRNRLKHCLPLCSRMCRCLSDMAPLLADLDPIRSRTWVVANGQIQNRIVSIAVVVRGGRYDVVGAKRYA